MEGQVIAFGVHQLGAARTDPVIGLEVSQQALAHAGAAAAGGDGDFDARFLHGAHGGGVLLGDLLGSCRGAACRQYLKATACISWFVSSWFDPLGNTA